MVAAALLTALAWAALPQRAGEAAHAQTQPGAPPTAPASAAVPPARDKSTEPVPEPAVAPAIIPGAAPDPSPVSGAAPVAAGASASSAALKAARQLAEDAQLRELVPPPLALAAIVAYATQLGAGRDADELVGALAGQYKARTQEELAKSISAVRPRLTSAFASTPSGGLEPTPGPELVAVLERSLAWRTLLADADGELLRQLVNVRTDTATASPALLSFMRAVERDDMPSLDPAAAVRLPALLDVAALDAAGRRRVEDLLERQWTRTAAAITARRFGQIRVQLERARLMEQWGPAWEITATPLVMEARRRQIAELEARARTTEDDLRTATRDAVQQLLRALPQEASTRVRDVVDTLVWPALFVQEDLLAQAAIGAAVGADPALAPAMQSVLLELRRRLEPTRRELSRRAGRAEELDAIVASVELGAAPQSAAASLNAQLDLQDTVDRRRKALREAAVQLRHMAASSGAPAAAVLDERVTAIDADARAARWLRRGLEERIQQLGLGGRERPEEPDENTPVGSKP